MQRKQRLNQLSLAEKPRDVFSVRHYFGGGNPSLRCPGVSPGFLDLAVASPAGVVLDVNSLSAVDGGEIQITNFEEMRPQAPDGHFGNVCEGLADGAAENEAAHLLVESSHVGVLDKGARLLLQVVDAVELSRYNLWGKRNGEVREQERCCTKPAVGGKCRAKTALHALSILNWESCSHSPASLHPPPLPPQEETAVLEMLFMEKKFINKKKKKLDFGVARWPIFTEVK